MTASFCDGMCPCDASGMCDACERKNHRDDVVVWLLERGQSEGFAMPEWYVIDSYQGRWTRNSLEAQRFDSEASAVEFIRHDHLTARAVRHGFVSGADR